MKIEPIDLIIDCLIWVTAPVVLVEWLQISYPIWKHFPPALLILVTLILLVGIAELLHHYVLPKGTPIWVWIIRGFQVCCGLALILWRLL